MSLDLFAWVYFWRIMLDAKGKLQQCLWLMDKMQYALWCYEKNADAVHWYQTDKIPPALKKKEKKPNWKILSSFWDPTFVSF